MWNSRNLQSLRLFLRVAQTLNFSDTAKLENMSQPALSRTIRLLEDELGVRLFDRDTRNVSLTHSGDQLIPIIERIVTEFDNAFGELRLTCEGGGGHIVAGLSPTVAAALLPDVIARFIAERPGVRVTIRDVLSGVLLEALEERQIDFAVVSQPGPSDRLNFRPLLKDEYVLVCRRDHALAGQACADWSMFEDYPFIAMAQKSCVRAVSDRVFLERGLVVTPLFECAQLATAMGLVTAGLGVTAMPRMALQMVGSPNIVTRPLIGPPITRSIGIVTLKSRTLLPACTALIDLLADVCAQTANPVPAR